MKLQSILKRFSVEQLREAIKLHKTEGKRTKLEAERADLQRQLAKVERQIAALNGNGAATTASQPGRRGRRKGYKLSPATRNRMRIAALKRYGKLKGEAPAAGKRKRKPMSAEAKEKMRQAALRRWAKVKGTAEPKAEAKA